MCRSSDTWRLCRLSEASTPLPSAIYGSRTTRKYPFQFQKRNSAEGNKKIGKGFFWWGERARAPAGVGAELRDFLGNRFGLRRKIAPKESRAEFVLGVFLLG